MVTWPNNLNKKVFGMKTTYKDNLVKISFESGKERTYLKNSSAKKTFTFSLRFEDMGAGSEYKAFLSFYEEILLSGSESFLFPDLITHQGDGLTTGTEYKLVTVPAASGQRFKTVNFSVEEV